MDAQTKNLEKQNSQHPLESILNPLLQRLLVGWLVPSMLLFLFIMPVALAQTTFAQSATDCYPEGVTFRNQSEIDHFAEEYPNCTHITGDLNIDESIDYAIGSLDGLSQITSVGGRLYMHWNQGVTTLNGLHNIHTIGGFLYLYDMDGLVSLDGLNGLRKIGEDIYISHNAVLQRLDGLEQLRELGGFIYLGYNFQLTDISALSGLHSIGERIELIYNSALTSLDGLQNISSSGITELVLFNASLEACHVSSICQYLENPANNASLGGNAMGCSTREEILSACESQYVDVSLQYGPDWNLVGLPVNQFHASATDLFPDMVDGSLFGFEGGYVPAEFMVPGVGYWMRLPDVANQTYSGNALVSDLWAVQEGWNLVSGLSNESVAVDSDGILVPGSLFSFDGGYVPADWLEAGRGYWVAAYEDGYVNVEGVSGLGVRDMAKQGTVDRILEVEGPMAGDGVLDKSVKVAKKVMSALSLDMREANTKIHFWDDNRKLRTLSIFDGADLPNLHPLEGALPPLPPKDVFDARFSDGRYLTKASSHKRVMLQVPSGTSPKSPIEFSVETFDDPSLIKVEVLNSLGRVMGRYFPDQGVRIPLLPGTAEMVLLQTETKRPDQDQEYSDSSLTETRQSEGFTPGVLLPNVPNPFNPETMISFSLPKGGNVTLEVFDLAGRRVATLANGYIASGTHSVRFDASGLSSGVYLMMMRTGSTESGFDIQVRSMTLVK